MTKTMDTTQPTLADRLILDIREFILKYQFVNDADPSEEQVLWFSKLEPFDREVEMQFPAPEWASEDYPSKEGWQ